MKHKKNLILTIIAITTLLIAVVGATYAYFTSTAPTTESISTNLTTSAGAGVFTSEANQTDLNIFADSNWMQEANNGENKTQTGTITATLTGSSATESTTCNYDIYYSWASGSDKFSATSSAKELTLEVVKSSTGNTDKKTDTPYAETNLDGTNDSYKVASGVIKISGIGTSVDKWDVNIRFYNLSTNQDAIKNKNYQGKVEVKNVTCTYATIQPIATELLTGELTSSSVTIDTSNMTTDEHTVGTTIYTNYRYTGANPDNYACLTSDCTQKFRIIGVFNEDTHGQSGQQLIKLVTKDTPRKTTYPKIPWDYKQVGVGSSTNEYGSNDWSDSQLMYMLNGFINSGYRGTTLLHTGYSYNSSTYYINDGTNNIYQLNNGNSYLTGVSANIKM